MSLHSGLASIDLRLANPSSDSTLVCMAKRTTGMANKNIATPLMRCRIETMPGSGSRIRTRLRYTGRRLITGGSLTDIVEERHGHASVLRPVPATWDTAGTRGHAGQIIQPFSAPARQR